MSLELLTDAHVSMCGIDVQTSRSRDKGKVQKAKTLFALSPILFVLQKNCQQGAIPVRTIISPAKIFSTVTKVQRTEPNLLPQLVLDRELKDPVFYYKCLFGSTDINVLEHTSFISHGRTRQSNSFNLQTPLAEPVLLIEASYFNRIKLT